MNSVVIDSLASGATLGLVDWANGKSMKHAGMDAAVQAAASGVVNWGSASYFGVPKIAESLVVGLLYVVVRHLVGKAGDKYLYDFLLSVVCHNSANYSKQLVGVVLPK